MTRARGRGARAALAGLALLAAVAGCRPPHPAGGGAAAPAPVMRGAVLYGGYCAGCHGTDGAGDGDLALMLGLAPANLRAPGVLASATDDEIVARLRAGDPLSSGAAPRVLGDEDDLRALEAYVLALATFDWNLLRGGRMLFEGECASCHGLYGDGDSVLGALPQVAPPDLRVARERYTDEGLATVSVEGIGKMPPLIGGFDPVEERALVAYVRHLSAGYRLYDTYCALCHGDDGRGVHPEDLLEPAEAAPPLTRARLARLGERERRAQILHMLEREQGSMPHFRGILDDRGLRDVVAYLRTWER